MENGAVKPVEANLKPLVLPELAVKLALGAKTEKKDGQVTLAFEGELVTMHESDYELAARAAKKLHQRLDQVRQRNISAILELAGYAHQYICEELFTPGLKRILYLASPVKANAFWRCAVPALALNARGKMVANLAASIKTARSCLPYDVIVVQLGHDPATFGAIRELQRMGKKIVFEFDDDMLSQEEWHGAYELYRTERVKNELKAMLATADAVTVTTEYLKEKYAPYAKRVIVSPNYLPLANWPKAEPHGTDEFRVLWAGAPSHFGDLQMVADVLKEFATRSLNIKFYFFGREPVGLDSIKDQVAVVPWCEFEEYPVKLAQLKADVAIAPLADVPFNKAKSWIKVLEYWGVGYPVVASNMGPYKGMGEGNLYLCSTKNEWLMALNGLWRHLDTRQALADKGKKAVCGYDIDAHAHEIEEFFTSL